MLSLTRLACSLCWLTLGASLVADPAPQSSVDRLPEWREAAALVELPGEEELWVQLNEQLLPLASDPDTEARQPLAALAKANAKAVALFRSNPGDRVELPVVHGPETPFPDHHAIRQLFQLSALRVRTLEWQGEREAAVEQALVMTRNLAAFLKSQEGVLSLIAATGYAGFTWETVYWLARRDDLSATDARRLIAALADHDGLTLIARERAYRGELEHVFKVIIDRLPATGGVSELLDGISTLGMGEVEKPEIDPFGEFPPDLLKPAETLELYGGLLEPYLAALRAADWHSPGTLNLPVAAAFRRWLEELGAFGTMVLGGEDDPEGEAMEAVRSALGAADNPFGKLAIILLFPPFERISESTFRREAERQGAVALLGLRIFQREANQPPAGWDDLVEAGALSRPPRDPFTGDPLRLGHDPLRVWSVHVDGADQGGKSDGLNSPDSEDLVWFAPASQ
jgi:hypothetical protein